MFFPFFLCLVILSALRRPFVTSTLQITPFTLADSVVLTTETKGICIPRHYYFLRGRYRYGATIKHLTGMIDIILIEMGKYGSAFESTEMQAKRICTTAAKGAHKYCPLGSVTPLTGEAKTLRHMILTDLDKIEYELGRILNVWNTFPSQYKSPDPAYTPEMIDNITRWTPTQLDSQNMPPVAIPDSPKPPPTVYYPHINDRIVTALNLVPEMFNNSSKRLQLPRDDTKLNDINNDHQYIAAMVTLSYAVEQAFNMLQKIQHTSLDLMRGQFPDDLFPIGTWVYNWFNIPVDNLSDKEKATVEYISHTVKGLPLTMARKIDCDPAYLPRQLNEDCVLDVVTMIPDYETMLRYEERKMTPHPVKDKNGRWMKVIIPSEVVLFYDSEIRKEHLMTTRRSLNCFSDPHSSPCRTCTSDTALKPVANECILAILNHNITNEVCEVEESAADSFQRVPKITIVTPTPPLDPRIPTTTEKLTAELVVSNDKPSAIIEKCSNGEHSYQLPSSAKVAISEKCQISFVNPPNIVDLVPGQEFPHIPIPTVNTMPHPDETAMEHGFKVLKVHFQDYGYVYILVTTSSVGFFLAVTVTCAIIRRAKRKERVRKQNEQQMISLLAGPNHPRALAIAQKPTISEIGDEDDQFV
jgi:hypothetical protein